SGAPQIGDVVQIFTSAATRGATAFTDANGYYSADNLTPGTYRIRGSAAPFVPSLKENVGLRACARVLGNGTLNSTPSALQSLRSRRPSTHEPDDWHWTLRSAANRPILRVTEEDSQGTDRGAQTTAVGEKLEDHGLKARVAFIAGSQAEGFGSAGDMTTA